MSYRVMDDQERELAEYLAAELRDGEMLDPLPSTGELVSTSSTSAALHRTADAARVTLWRPEHGKRPVATGEFEVTIVVRRIG